MAAILPDNILNYIFHGLNHVSPDKHAHDFVLHYIICGARWIYELSL